MEVLFFVVAAFFAVCATVSAVRLFSAIATNAADSGLVGPVAALCAFYLMVLVLVEAALVFRDISHGESPFTDKQAKRIRIISLLLLAYAVLDSAIPRMPVEELASQGATNLVHGQTSQGYYGVNIGLFIVAMVFFFLSSVFKYGVELQELSDDVV